ncbi:MAG: Co2+/Mg2+ efflux protein ApaG [Myxococcota bacterium]|nr:Co2+/Mg2+ efflux protein ApaG [Myxococcota bacterium]
MSEAVTEQVRVHVESAYIAARSNPSESYFFFAYRVTIKNEGKLAVKLLARHWIITDGFGKIDHVKGAGVVGEQPLLTQDQSFSYTSACPLPTPSGHMRGTYEMLREDGTRFEVDIPAFKLLGNASLH